MNKEVRFKLQDADGVEHDYFITAFGGLDGTIAQVKVAKHLAPIIIPMFAPIVKLLPQLFDEKNGDKNVADFFKDQLNGVDIISEVVYGLASADPNGLKDLVICLLQKAARDNKFLNELEIDQAYACNYEEMIQACHRSILLNFGSYIDAIKKKLTGISEKIKPSLSDSTAQNPTN